ncbi:MAG TPA: glycosyltransferase, partial [Kribbellaceae bacterium]|nr:glycosyltransferase [Kribbellaceae bacterium]
GQLAALRQAVAHADVIVSLKEQPLAALRAVGTAGKPLITCLHRSDPEHQGSALADLVGLYDDGLLTAAICCAASTQRAYHEATGIPLDRLPVIPNGVDLYRFRPVADQRERVRLELGADASAPVVVLAARFDEMKNVPLFVRSAREFVARYPEAHLVMCGAGMSRDNPHLVALLDAEFGGWAGRRTQVHPLGIQSAMAPIYNAADLVTLTSSYGEAAPLSLLEGMACGAVPVTTDVGDAATIVGDPRLVTAAEPAAVSEAWAAAFEQREEHAERILRHRQRLSDQRCFDAYAGLIARSVDVEAASSAA